jgi:hypothetical protein
LADFDPKSKALEDYTKVAQILTAGPEESTDVEAIKQSA